MLLTFYFESSRADNLSQVIGRSQFVVATIGGLNIEDDEGDHSVLVRDLDTLRWRDLSAIPVPVESWRRIRIDLDDESVGEGGEMWLIIAGIMCISVSLWKQVTRIQYLLHTFPTKLWNNVRL